MQPTGCWATTKYNSRYDSLDRVVTTAYPDGEAVTNTYNAATYLQQVSGTSTYASGLTYNASGQPTGMGLGNGLSTAYGYDTRQRLASINTGSGAVQDLAYGYDGVGNITAITDTLRTEVLGFSLDALDRLETTGSPIPDSHTYSTTGNLTAKGGSSYTYSASILQHDDFSQGAGNWQPASGAWVIETAGGPVYGNNNPTGLWETSLTGSPTWDNYSVQMEVREVGANGGGMAILFRVQDDPTYYYQFSLQFGRARLYKREGANWTFLNETMYSWNADTWYALTVVVNGNQIDTYVNGQYQFTPYDSTFSKGRVGVDSWNGHHQYRQLFAGRLSPRAHAVSQAGSVGFEYDPNGNMVNDWTRRLTYDADNRLTKVVSGTLTTSFVYDGDGRMVARALQDGASTTTTYYVGGHYEAQVVGGNQTITKYYYANGKRVAFRISDAASPYYVHSDNLGSASKVTNSSGSVVNPYLYYPWGSARERSEQIAYDYRYNGQHNGQRAVDSAGMSCLSLSPQVGLL
ncbi:MAG: hypothetical protein M1582_02585 [Actinobacteria bacterium]|nr:hypothetical protein [Actinomycetota bacterium]